MGKFTVDSYAPTVDSNQGLSSGVAPYQGQSFTGAAGWLTEVVFKLQRGATASGTITARLLAHSGTYGTSSVPTGVALATSDEINSSAVPNGSYSDITFTFSGANRVQLTAGTKYVIVVDASAAGATSFLVGSRVTAPAHSGNAVVYISGSWTPYAEDLYFSVSAYNTPLIVTNAATSVGSTKSTMNGSIDQVGGSTPTERGFVYATSSKPDPGSAAPSSSGYTYNYLESGSYGIAAFSKKIAQLQPLTTYYARAFAKNSSGYAYGAEVSFTMLNLTTVTFTNTDPADIFRACVDNTGGPLTYDGTSVDNTGVTVSSYTFITETILEGVRKALELAPQGFYWYVDPGTNMAYYKRAPTTATHKLTIGRHLTQLNLALSIQQVKNAIYFTGGEVAGNNLLKVYKDDASIAKYGQKALRISNNRVTDASIAQTISTPALQTNRSEQYVTRVSVQAKDYDTTLFKPGDTVGFEGGGVFINSLLLQIVRHEYHPSYSVLSLGTIAPRLSDAYEQTRRELIAQQTVKNPATPA